MTQPAKSRKKQFHATKSLRLALEQFRVANRVDTLFNQGFILHQQGKFNEAQVIYEQILAIQPNHFDALQLLGAVFVQACQFEQAEDFLSRALELRTDYPDAYNNRGIALNALGRLDEALVSYDQAIAIKPHYAEAYNNRGVPLKALRRLDEALISFDQAIKLRPDYAEAFWNKSHLKIMLGEYEEGWSLHEWRWKAIQMRESFSAFSQPLWLGQEPIKDKIIFIHAEQGFGDTIQFCRYVEKIEALSPKKIILEVPKALLSLLSTLNSRCDRIEQGGSIPEFDLHCPIMSLPHAFKTALETIPASIPYLYAEVNKVKDWDKKLGLKTKARVGLVWSGSVNHVNDNNRSLLFEQLAPILELPLEFHCLQKEVRPIDIGPLTKFKQIHQHQEDLLDFSDTAALIQCLDLVITVDTSVAHLAGAMGKDVFILLPYAPDYRWMLDRIDSPWYPTARLYRQEKMFKWDGVLERVKADLSKLTEG
jgi:tetratricopeptide (TPR) repeat protein